MESKKYTLLLALMLCAASGVWAQLGGVHNYMDSSYIPARRMAQQNEWKNNSPAQNFPARPRDMWQLGVTGGLLLVDGDCPALPGYNVGLSIRKSLGYTLSLRGSLTYGETKGLDYRRNPNLANNAALNIYRTPGTPLAPPNAVGPGYYVANFKSTIITPSLDALISLNNIMFHSKQNRLNIYALIGYSPIIYKTQIDALRGTAPYNFASLPASFYQRPRKDIRKDLKNFFDGSYETSALLNDRSQNFNKSGLGKYNFRHSYSAGIGAEYRVTKRFSVSAEFKYTVTNDDYIDGWVFQSGDVDSRGDNRSAVSTSDKDNLIYTNISLNFNLGNAKKRTAPLWWLNPLDHVYGEINNPKHTLFPKQVLPDGDEDGVTDQFDIEPNTPAGCPVDTKGKSRDTDGDGVPDCRDKELITPTACQPVNADGVGKCPDPQCCTDIKNAQKVVDDKPKCEIGELPSVTFKNGVVKISGDVETILASAAAKIKANPLCKICVVGHGAADKRAQQLSWDRVDNIIAYLTQKQGISSDRFVFKYGVDGEANTVDLQDCTGEEGPNTVPAPHPQLHKK